MPQTMPTALAAKASFGDYTRCGTRPTLHNDKRRNICENGPYKRPRIKRGLYEKERTLPPKMLLLNLAYKKRRIHATHLLPPALEQQRNDEVYPRLIRSAHRLAAIRVALAAGINLLGMALMAFIAIQLAMRGIVRIVRFQIGSLLSKRLIAIAVTR